MPKYIVGFREDGDCGYRGSFHGADIVEISDEEYHDLYWELNGGGYSLIRVEESPQEIIDRFRSERTVRIEKERQREEKEKLRKKENAEKRRQKQEAQQLEAARKLLREKGELPSS